jgi:hypothetical protein
MPGLGNRARSLVFPAVARRLEHAGPRSEVEGSDRIEWWAPGFQFRRTDALPPLAWCAEVRRGVRDVVLKHGRFVETTHDAFFEGVWNGSFVDFDFRSSHTTRGSGGCVEGERLCFVAPSHTYESLVTLVDGDRLWVSNSMRAPI